MSDPIDLLSSNTTTSEVGGLESVPGKDAEDALGGLSAGIRGEEIKENDVSLISDDIYPSVLINHLEKENIQKPTEIPIFNFADPCHEGEANNNPNYHDFVKEESAMLDSKIEEQSTSITSTHENQDDAWSCEKQQEETFQLEKDETAEDSGGFGDLDGDNCSDVKSLQVTNISIDIDRQKESAVLDSKIEEPLASITSTNANHDDARSCEKQQEETFHLEKDETAEDSGGFGDFDGDNCSEVKSLHVANTSIDIDRQKESAVLDSKLEEFSVSLISTNENQDDARSSEKQQEENLEIETDETAEDFDKFGDFDGDNCSEVKSLQVTNTSLDIDREEESGVIDGQIEESSASIISRNGNQNDGRCEKQQEENLRLEKDETAEDFGGFGDFDGDNCSEVKSLQVVNTSINIDREEESAVLDGQIEESSTSIISADGNQDDDCAYEKQQEETLPRDESEDFGDFGDFDGDNCSEVKSLQVANTSIDIDRQEETAVLDGKVVEPSASLICINENNSPSCEKQQEETLQLEEDESDDFGDFGDFNGDNCSEVQSLQVSNISIDIDKQEESAVQNGKVEVPSASIISTNKNQDDDRPCEKQQEENLHLEEEESDDFGGFGDFGGDNCSEVKSLQVTNNSIDIDRQEETAVQDDTIEDSSASIISTNENQDDACSCEKQQEETLQIEKDESEDFGDFGDFDGENCSEVKSLQVTNTKMSIDIDRPTNYDSQSSRLSSLLKQIFPIPDTILKPLTDDMKRTNDPNSLKEYLVPESLVPETSCSRMMLFKTFELARLVLEKRGEAAVDVLGNSLKNQKEDFEAFNSKDTKMDDLLNNIPDITFMLSDRLKIPNPK